MVYKKLEIDTNKLAKLNEFRAAKIEPYPYKYDATSKAKEVNQKYSVLEAHQKTNDTASVAGRLMLKRVMGKASFFHLQDNSGRIQLYLNVDNLGKENYDLFTKKTDTGDILGVKGTIFKTKMGEVTIEVKELTLLCKSLLPMPEKFHGLKDEELRYRQRYVDLFENPEVREVFVKRAKIYKAIREFLNDKGFMEVQTPILQPQYGGASAKPFITHINAWNMKIYMRIAYELYLKRLLVGGFEKIYDLSCCYRNEDSDRTHNPEFSMMEIQWAYADYNDAMSLAENLWEYSAKSVLGTTVIEYNGNKIDLKAPWQRLTMKEAIKKFASIDIDKLDDNQLISKIRGNKIDVNGKELNRGNMIVMLFEELCEKKLIQPTHIIDHPKESCPLAKPHRRDPSLIERAESFIAGWEVCNLYSELTDPVLQRKLLEEQANKSRGGDEEAHPMDEDYINALEYGLPPNAGLGIGIDRMVMLLTGSYSIRDVILFPTMKPQELDVETGKS